MTGILRRRPCEETQTCAERRRPCDGGRGRGWSNASASQGMSWIAGNHQKLQQTGKPSSLEPLVETWPH